MTEDNALSEVHSTDDEIQDDDENCPSDIDSVLENIPKEDRRVIKRMIGMSMQMGGSISPEVELMKKMTPEHVSDFLSTQKEAMQNSYKEKNMNKLFLFLVLLVTLVFIIVLIILLKDKPEVMEKVLFTLGGLITGLFGGYGIGKTKQDD
ncbi:hypothetical protein [Lacrimispora indolis]|uniref:hypothetical protein n=1 Tax=Lacrimispora indolis TaxID=69825 RepID=UPI000462DAB9|nr:hypothetical protein [[Clostridium] methoxybenzovorans]